MRHEALNVSKLGALASTPRSGPPPDEAYDDVAAARANGYGWGAIAKALTEDGHPIGKGGVQAWFERHERSNSDSTR